MKYASPLNVCAKCALREVIITSTALTWGNNLALAVQIIGSNSPVIFGASNLPSGLSVNTSTGIISGTTTVLGVHVITVWGTNRRNNTGYGTITLTIVNGYFSLVFTKSQGGSPNTVQIKLEFSSENNDFETVDTSKTYYIFTTGSVRTSLVNSVSFSSNGSFTTAVLTAHGANITLKDTSNISATGSFTGSSLEIVLTNSSFNGSLVLEPPSSSPFNQAVLLAGTVTQGNTGGTEHVMSSTGAGSVTLNSCQMITKFDI